MRTPILDELVVGILLKPCVLQQAGMRHNNLRDPMGLDAAKCKHGDKRQATLLFGLDQDRSNLHLPRGATSSPDAVLTAGGFSMRGS